jgi:hypothetical protein
MDSKNSKVAINYDLHDYCINLHENDYDQHGHDHHDYGQHDYVRNDHVRNDHVLRDLMTVHDCDHVHCNFYDCICHFDTTLYLHDCIEEHDVTSLIVDTNEQDFQMNHSQFLFFSFHLSFLIS